MSEQTMPAAEAEGVVVDERNSYELAFHVLPTVAEGEVDAVVDALKSAITNAGGSVSIEEAAKRIELAYEIERTLEGKVRKFQSAYFGWIRFQAPGEAIADIEEYLKDETNLLRHLLIKLSKLEEAHPVYYHELMTADGKVVETVEVDEVAAEVVAPDTEADTATAPADESEEATEAGADETATDSDAEKTDDTTKA